MRKTAAILLTLVLGTAASAANNVPLRNWNRAVVPHTDISDRAAFIAVEPCRLVDTRNANGAYGGPAFTVSETRTYDIPAGPCASIPVAAAYSLSFAVVSYSGPGWITAFPALTTQPGVSTVNYGSSGPAVANAAIVAATSGSISVFSSKATHVIIDINGYFLEPASAITSIDAGDGLTATGTTTVTVGVDFAGTGSATTVARSDHSHYARTIIVNPAGTDVQNGNALEAAIAAINDSSATNPYLVKIAPGVYDIEDDDLQMPEYVHVEGSGRGTTTVTGAATLFRIDGPGIEIRNLTLTATDDIFMVHALADGVSLVDLEFTGSTGGQLIGVQADAGTSWLTRVTMDLDAGTAYGVLTASDTTIYLRETHITVDGTSQAYGIAAQGGADVRRSSITTSGAGVATSGAFDASEVVIRATGTGADTTGVSLSGTATVSLRGMNIQSSGPFATGISSVNPNLTVYDTQITTSGTTNFGIFQLQGGAATLSNVVVDSTGTALRNGPSSTAATVNVHRGRLEGATAISSTANYTVNVGNAQVDGTVTVTGTIQCANAFDGAYDALDGVCQ